MPCRNLHSGGEKPYQDLGPVFSDGIIVPHINGSVEKADVITER